MKIVYVLEDAEYDVIEKVVDTIKSTGKISTDVMNVVKSVGLDDAIVPLEDICRKLESIENLKLSVDNDLSMIREFGYSYDIARLEAILGIRDDTRDEKKGKILVVSRE